MPCAISASVDARGAGAAGAVVAPDRLAGLGDHAEAVAADAGHVRLDHAEHRDRGHRRVGRIAARAQRLDRGERRQRMRGRRHALAGDDRRAARQMEVAAHAGRLRGKGAQFAGRSAQCMYSIQQRNGAAQMPSCRRLGKIHLTISNSPNPNQCFDAR